MLPVPSDNLSVPASMPAASGISTSSVAPAAGQDNASGLATREEMDDYEARLVELLSGFRALRSRRSFYANYSTLPFFLHLFAILAN